jgi:predicted dehydrogenase
VAELFHWFLGDLPCTAFAKVLHSRPEARDGGAPDAAVVTYEFDQARHALMSVSWMHPTGWGPFYASSQIVGRLGKIDYHDREAHPTIVVGDRIEIPHPDPLLSALGPTFQTEIEHFAQAIETGDPFTLTLEDAITALDMIDAAERSARSGRPERIAS